jgi:hypothetical protein
MKQQYSGYNINQLMLVNHEGRITVLYTPFRALTVDDSIGLPYNTWVFVDEVHGDDKDLLYYMIGGSMYLCWHFHIPVKF